MSAKVFVDTNVLVYARDDSEPEKQQKAMAWMTHLWSSQAGRLSFQILQEFYSTVTQKLHPGMDLQSARNDVQSLFAWHPTYVGADTIQGAWSIQDRFKLSWWDSLVLSAAQIADCRYLLTEDFQENQVFGNVRVIDPFLHSPELLNAPSE